MSFWPGRAVLVTGGAGFIGANLVERLLREGADVRVVDNLERSGSARPIAPNAIGRLEFRTADLRDAAAAAAACADREVVFHLAGRVGSSDYYRRFAADVLLDNLRIDATMLDSARHTGVARYFYMSSVWVYPQRLQQGAEAVALREEDALPADPPVSYGWAKLLGERALQYATDGTTEGTALRGAIFRLMNAYGPHQDIDPDRASIIPALIRRAVEYPAVPFTIRGDGEETRTYCYIDDLVDAMLRAIELLDREMLIGPLNVGSEQRVRIIDLAREIAQISGKGMEVVRLPTPAAAWTQAIDCSRARAVLDGWVPRVPLREGLRRTFDDVERRLRSH